LLFLEYLNNLDINLSIAINSFNSPFFDKVMVAVSEPIYWLPLYALVILVLVKHYKKNTVVVMVALGVVVSLCDSITFLIFKPLFGVLRPCHNPEVSSLLHLLPDYCGGRYGFASSHAANITGVATFLYLLLGHKYKAMKLAFVVAFLVCYSRVYLGVHYVSDVVAGAILGAIIANFIFRFLKHLYKNIDKISQSKILYFKQKTTSTTTKNIDKW